MLSLISQETWAILGVGSTLVVSHHTLVYSFLKKLGAKLDAEREKNRDMHNLIESQNKLLVKMSEELQEGRREHIELMGEVRRVRDWQEAQARSKPF